MDQETLKSIRDSLEGELRTIEHQLGEYGVAVDGGVDLSVDEGFADSAQATAERSEMLSFIEQLQATRAEVLAALRRIDEGVYGKCERCGREIPPERLEALPTATLCVTCKQASRSG